MKNSKMKLKQLSIQSFITHVNDFNPLTIKGGFQDLDTEDIPSLGCSRGCSQNCPTHDCEDC